MSLSPRKQRAVLALVESSSVAAAAVASGVSRQTLYRWMREPEFATMLRQASGERVEQASRELTAMMSKAVEVLHALLESGSEHQRRLAADSIITNAIRLRELVELESRIVELEKRYLL